MEDIEELRVVIFEDGDLWVAQCLEYDIGVQAKDLTELHARFSLVFEAELRESMHRHGKEFAGIGPAPKRFHDMWEQCSGQFSPRSDGDRPYKMALCA